MIAKIIIIGWTLFTAYSFISGLVTVMGDNPSDAVLGFALMVSVIFHGALWALVAVPTYLISRMFVRKSHA